MRRFAKRFLIAAVLAFGAIQLVPYGRAHDNPPVRAEPRWDSEATREFARRACFDCHSNETRWPWYSHVAPMSWLVQRDVQQGRRELNFSEWDVGQKDARKAAREFEEGEMPPWFYLPAHPEAKLDAQEHARFAAGLRATFGD